MLSIIFPIRDEEKNLEKITALFHENKFNFDFEVLFINDFSKDNSLDEMRNISIKYKNFKYFDNDQIGIGGAVNLGIKKSEGEYCCIMMADLSDDLEDLKKYYNIIKDNELDAIFGSRFIKGSKVSGGIIAVSPVAVKNSPPLPLSNLNPSASPAIFIFFLS